ncbi:copper resistance CopC family protein [Candidatus Binatus sp.]|uniref:copper resistance CopC family protein n=1 Tax=Candidatus Binatus sp. TaxID=2811406 RepID=UPI003BD403D7
MSSPIMSWAHSFPDKETPSAGQKIASPPSEVVIDFDAPIEKLFAKLEVTGADGKNEAAGAPQVSEDGRQLSVKVGALKPGDYTVKWAVVCIDTHHTEGSYTFSVANGS